MKMMHIAVADPGFLVGGRGLPRWLRFENFVCQSERIWTLRGACAGHGPSRSANAQDVSAMVLLTNMYHVASA